MGWPLQVNPTGPIALGCVLWERRGRVRATAIVKASFAMIHAGFAMPTQPIPILTEDDQHGVSELWPQLSFPQVSMVCDAIALGREPVRAMAVRLVVWKRAAKLDKTLHVFGARSTFEDVPAPFVESALTWDKTPVGENGHNPLGVRPPRAPEMQNPNAPTVPGCFAPMGWDRPERGLVGKTMPPRLSPEPWTWPDGVMPEAFSAAPLDQRLPTLDGDEWVILDGVHPELERFATRLPAPRARASLRDETGRSEAFPLVLDTLAIDARARTISLVWRGALPLLREHWSDFVIDGGLELGEPDDLTQAGAATPMMLGKGMRIGAKEGGGPASVVSPQQVARPVTPADYGAHAPPLSPPALLAPAMSPAAPAPVVFGPPPGPAPAALAPPALAPPALAPPALAPPALALQGMAAPGLPPLSPLLPPVVNGRGTEPPPPLISNPTPPAFETVPPPAAGLVDAMPFSKRDGPRPLPTDLSPIEPAGRGETLPPPPPDDAPRSTAPPPPPADVSVPPATASPSAPAMVPPPAVVPPAVVPPAIGPASPGATSALRPPPPAPSKPEKAPPPFFDPTDVSEEVSVDGEEVGTDDRPLDATQENASLAKSGALPSAESSMGVTAANLAASVRATLPLRIAEGRPLNDLPLAGLDLSEMDLRSANFADANLAGAKLMRVKLEGAKLMRAKLVGADLTGAILEGVDLSGADLSRAVLKGASFEGATLTDANLSAGEGAGANFADAKAGRVILSQGRWAEASFERAELAGCDFSGADLAKARFADANIVGSRFVDAKGKEASFARARMTDANLAGAQLAGSDFTGVDAQRTSWDRAALSGASFKEAVLDGSGFARAVIEQANFASATLTKASLMGVQGDRSDFTQANLEAVDLRQGKLVSAIFSGAKLVRCNALKSTLAQCRFDGADLTGTSLRSAKLRGASFDNAVLKEADLRDADVDPADLRAADTQGARLSGAAGKGASEG